MKIAICQEGGWRLTPLCIKTYYKKKDQDCYCYFRQMAGDYSIRHTNDSEYDDRLYYYSIDFGDEVDWMTLMEIPARLEDNGDRLRTDPIFIQTLQELGDQAYAKGTIIRIVDVPDEAEYEIETDGFNHDTSIYYREDIFVKQYL